MKRSGALQRPGDVAAFAAALTYLFGFAVLFGPLAERPATIDAGLLYLLEHRALVIGWYLVIYIAFGVALLVLALALFERLRARAPTLSSIARALALVWVTLVVAAGMCLVVGLDAAATLLGEDAARAVTLWLVVETIADGLGGGIEAVGGLWLTLLGVAGWRSGIDARGVHALALVSGVAGLLTVLPPLGTLGAVFGLGQIAWFVGIGCALVRTPLIDEPPGRGGCRSLTRSVARQPPLATTAWLYAVLTDEPVGIGTHDNRVERLLRDPARASGVNVPDPVKHAVRALSRVERVARSTEFDSRYSMIRSTAQPCRVR